jgi:tetratricopeptide (TPR) repeat protein
VTAALNPRLFPLLAGALALALFVNVLPNTFIFDDWQQIFENPYLRDPQGLRKIFTTNVWGFEGKHTNFYRPLMHMAFWVNLRLFGFNPAGYHALSLLLHALASVLVYFVLRKLAGEDLVALFGALLFAAHPIHTENVCWISNYPDLMAAVFVLLAWLIYEARWRRLPACAALFACVLLGLLSKEIAVVAPVMALATELHRRREGWLPALAEVARTRWPEYLAMAAAGAVYFLLRAQALGGLMPYAQTRALPGEVKFFTNVALFFRYWAKLLWPADLNAFPHFPVSRGLQEPLVLLGALTILAFVAATVWLWRARRPEALGLILFAGALAPAFTLPYGDINILAERYLYLPSFGFCWLAASGAVWLLRRKEVFAVGLLVAVLGLYSTRTVLRNADWRSEIPFYEKTARQSPQMAEVFTLLGEAYLRRNLLPEALAATQRASELKARYAEAHNNLGQIYSRMNQPQRAVAEYRKAAAYALEQSYTLAAARAWNNIGYELHRAGKVGEAVAAYQRALELQPHFAGALNNLGYVRLLAGDDLEAERWLRAALREDPAMVPAVSNLGLLYLRRGDLDQAEAHLNQAVRMEPRDGEAVARLGDVAAARGDRPRAAQLYRRALELHPTNERAAAGLGK